MPVKLIKWDSVYLDSTLITQIGDGPRLHPVFTTLKEALRHVASNGVVHIRSGHQEFLEGSVAVGHVSLIGPHNPRDPLNFRPNFIFGEGVGFQGSERMRISNLNFEMRDRGQHFGWSEP
jgi:hypothetical protein